MNFRSPPPVPPRLSLTFRFSSSLRDPSIVLHETSKDHKGWGRRTGPIPVEKRTENHQRGDGVGREVRRQSVSKIWLRREGSRLGKLPMNKKSPISGLRHDTEFPGSTKPGRDGVTGTEDRRVSRRWYDLKYVERTCSTFRRFSEFDTTEESDW